MRVYLLFIVLTAMLPKVFRSFRLSIFKSPKSSQRGLDKCRPLGSLASLSMLNSRLKWKRSIVLFSTSSNVEDIVSQIKAKGDEIRKLKEAKAEKGQIAPIVESMLLLKAEYEKITGTSYDPVKDVSPTKEQNVKVEPSSPVSGKSSKKVNPTLKNLENVAGEKVQGIDELRQVRLEKMKQIREAGVNPFAYVYSQSHKTVELQERYKSLANGVEDETTDVSVAGRIMVRRVFGKLAFFELQDDTGTIQLYIEKGRLGDSFQKIQEWTDSGDIIGARGTVKRTEKGELSVYVKEWEMLTKSILPLPDKYHGLKDLGSQNIELTQNNYNKILVQY